MSRRIWFKAGITIFTLCLVFIFGAASCSNQNANAPTGSNATTQKTSQTIAKDESLVIPISELSSTAKFYPINVDGEDMEVIAVKTSDGKIRTAFNTCQVCYDSGRGYYKQQGSSLVCQNCGNKFTMTQIEAQAGGCNPYPIFAKDKTVTDQNVSISYDFFNESKDIFANWKQEY
ncbi:MAG: DUF2318 domain-containing protein [Clostridiales bacterium]|jgi:uncharacterized membrane protein|nr:DUF2318 domain-containing protein [Clostridiales bacterium]